MEIEILEFRHVDPVFFNLLIERASREAKYSGRLFHMTTLCLEHTHNVLTFYIQQRQRLITCRYNG